MGSRRVPEMWDLGEYQKCGIWARPEMWDPGEYRGGNIRVSTGKGRIRASIGEGKILVSTGNVGSGRVLEMWDLGEYQKCGIWASTGKVTSGRVPEKV